MAGKIVHHSDLAVSDGGITGLSDQTDQTCVSLGLWPGRISGAWDSRSHPISTGHPLAIHFLWLTLWWFQTEHCRFHYVPCQLYHGHGSHGKPIHEVDYGWSTSWMGLPWLTWQCFLFKCNEYIKRHIYKTKTKWINIDININAHTHIFHKLISPCLKVESPLFMVNLLMYVTILDDI